MSISDLFVSFFFDGWKKQYKNLNWEIETQGETHNCEGDPDINTQDNEEMRTDKETQLTRITIMRQGKQN